MTGFDSKKRFYTWQAASKYMAQVRDMIVNTQIDIISNFKSINRFLFFEHGSFWISGL